MKTVAVIPCYNEEVAIGSVVLKAREQVEKVLVVDDGSTDATAQIARAAGANIISHEKNKGKGAAIKTALEYVAGNGFDTLVLLDGDAQHDPNQIPLLLKAFQRDNADIVIGYRSPEQMPFHRRVGRQVLDYTTGINGAATDSQSGFRALNRRAVDALESKNLRGNGFSIESEMLLAAEELNLNIKEVPVTCSYGNGKTSTKNPISHGFGVLGSIIRLIAEERPLVFVGIPGLVMIFMGFFFGLKLLQLYNDSGYFSIPFTMLAGFFVVIGTLGVFMGLVLNVVSRLVKK
ncbi:UDP-N-acetylglucosamine--dolichyl-phosphate N-acetylglucosaminyltransferase [ANME-1 cluster archaeon GoMg2]|nr:UDP-N-acetylglucosamine--dolichyl-phosphate N-acetylglucosaminyltransferase [ANME-1 cluster archaeon GoMg2]